MFNFRVQDLRDTSYERERNLFNKRGWFETWRWQLVISKNPFRAYGLLKFNIQIVAGKCLSGLTLGLLGITLYSHRNKYSDIQGNDYGFYTDDDAFVVKWNEPFLESGGFIKFFYYPWSYDYCQTEFVNHQGKFIQAPPSLSWFEQNRFTEDNKKYDTYPYTYILKDGTVQNRKAKVSVERRTWWQRWFGLGKKHLTPKKVRTSINVEFDGEVGERTGSWKGGTLGCGYDLLPNETPEQCLRRMESERKFN